MTYFTRSLKIRYHSKVQFVCLWSVTFPISSVLSKKLTPVTFHCHIIIFNIYHSLWFPKKLSNVYWRWMWSMQWCCLLHVSKYRVFVYLQNIWGRNRALRAGTRATRRNLHQIRKYNQLVACYTNWLENYRKVMQYIQHGNGRTLSNLRVAEFVTKKHGGQFKNYRKIPF